MTPMSIQPEWVVRNMTTADPRGHGPSRPNTPIEQYPLELFYRHTPPLKGNVLLSQLVRRCPDLAPSPVITRPGTFVFSHRAHAVAHSGGRMLVQRAIVASSAPPEARRYEPSLAQSWSWPEAREAASGCEATVLVTDVFAVDLPALHRLILVENVLVALVEAFPPQAIHWQPTQQFVDPQAFLAAYQTAGGMVLMPGPLNVRMFRDDTADMNTSGEHELLMDTLGLAALGLFDLQCRFSGLDSAAVSRVLYNTALYMIERGSTIDDGDTIPGIEPQSRWVCRRTESTALPQRAVLDLAPLADQ
jgi:hypothetical protein